MKFLLISDMHGTFKTSSNRKDNVKKTFLRKSEFIFDYARKHGLIVLQAGDFCNQPRDWNLLYYLIEIIKGLKVYSVYGQHDIYLRSNSSATTLGVLEKTGYVDILGSKPIRLDGVHLYGSGWKEEVPVPKRKNSVTNILIIHSPITNRELHHSIQRTEAEKFLKDHPYYDLILTGDIHMDFEIWSGERVILNTGPVLRLEASVYNLKYKPSFYIYDSSDPGLRRVKIPCERGIKVLDRSRIETKREEGSVLERFVKSLKRAPKIRKKIKDSLMEYMKDNNVPNSIQKEIMTVAEEVAHGSRNIKAQDR